MPPNRLFRLEKRSGKKSHPNEAFIQYCSDSIKAITVFRHNLRATDEDVIARILDPNDTIVGGSV